MADVAMQSAHEAQLPALQAIFQGQNVGAVFARNAQVPRLIIRPTPDWTAAIYLFMMPFWP